MEQIKSLSLKYHLHIFAILQLVFLLFHRPLIELWSSLKSDDNLFFKPDNGMISLLCCLIFEVLWLVALVYSVMSILYKEQTGGRDFLTDRRLYARSYTDLVSFFRDSDNTRLDTEKLQYQSWKDTSGIPLGTIDGRLIKRDTDAPGNLMLFGLPGFNKTTSGIATAALRFGATVPESYYDRKKYDRCISRVPPTTTGSTVVIDIKGDILHWTKGKRWIKIFDPENPESIHFNPFLGVQKMSLSERRNFIEGMSLILVQEEEGGKYFTDGGRDMFCGVALYMLNEDLSTGFMQVVDAILHGNVFDWVERIVDGDCDEAKDYCASYMGSSEKNVQGCWNSVAKSLRKFKSGALPDILNGDGECISIDMLDAGFDLYLEIRQDRFDIYSVVISLLISQILNAGMQRPDSSSGAYNRPILLLLDEMPKLRFDFETLETCLSTMRSKNITCMMAAQSIGQYKKRYGDQGFINLVDCCQYITCMSALEPESRKWFSDLIGTRKVLRRSTSTGYNPAGNGGDFSASGNVSIQETREPVIQPEIFSQLDDKAVIYIVGQGYVVADKVKVFE